MHSVQETIRVADHAVKCGRGGREGGRRRVYNKGVMKGNEGKALIYM
jgi:hypothetical protein